MNSLIGQKPRTWAGRSIAAMMTLVAVCPRLGTRWSTIFNNSKTIDRVQFTSSARAPAGKRQRHVQYKMRRVHGASVLALAVFGSLGACTNALGQWPASEDFMVMASDGEGRDFFGRAVSIDDDVALIGAYNVGDTDGAPDVGFGAAYVFRFDGSEWHEEAILPNPDPALGDHFGWSVALSGDVAVVGAPDKNGDCSNCTRSGVAYVFRYDAGTESWSQEAELTASDPLEVHRFGQSVSIKDDVIAIGADRSNLGPGSAYIFERDAGGPNNWGQVAKLNTTFAGLLFGFSAAVGDDVVAIGDSRDDTFSGAVFVFAKPETGWTDMTETARLIASDRQQCDRLGFSLAISGDVIVAGAREQGHTPGCSPDDGHGAAYVFVKPEDGWADMTETAKLTASDRAADDELGISVAVEGDVVVAGAWKRDGPPNLAGAAYVFEKPSNGWRSMTETARLTASDADADDLFASAVAISHSCILVGALGDNFNAGSAYVFCRGNLNLPPVADAVLEQLTDIGSQALLRLDGSGTSDPDHANEELLFDWKIENIATSELIYRTGAVIEELVDFGDYSVVLRVTDPDGAFDEVNKSITLDPAALSSLSLDRVKVLWSVDPRRVKITGEIGLPSGVDFGELSPMVVIHADLAGNNIDSMEPVIPDVIGHKWKFHDDEVIWGVHKLDINWRGTRYNFREQSFPVHIKSQVITSSETILTVRLRTRHIDAPFTIDFDGQGIVDIDANGNVLVSTIPIEVEVPGKELTLTLPIPLVDTSVITMAGGVNRTLVVGDDLKESVGRFRLDLRLDPNLFPDGVDTTPRTFDLEVLLGMAGYPGASTLGPDELKVKNNRWLAK